MKDAQLQTAYQEALRRRQVAGSEACPQPDALIALVERRGPEEERMPTLDHVMQCNACHDEFEMLRALRAGATRRVMPTWVRASLPAAAAIAVLIGGVSVWRAMQAGGEPFRGSTRNAVELVAPIGDVSMDDARMLVWHAVAGAVRYEVEVTSGGGAAVHTGLAFDTAATVPDGVRLSAGTDYTWWVTAVLPDGSRGRSEPFVFTPGG